MGPESSLNSYPSDSVIFHLEVVLLVRILGYSFRVPYLNGPESQLHTGQLAFAPRLVWNHQAVSAAFHQESDIVNRNAVLRYRVLCYLTVGIKYKNHQGCADDSIVTI